jgi:hypothetical protein
VDLGSSHGVRGLEVSVSHVQFKVCRFITQVVVVVVARLKFTGMVLYW